MLIVRSIFESSDFLVEGSTHSVMQLLRGPLGVEKGKSAGMRAVSMPQMLWPVAT